MKPNRHWGHLPNAAHIDRILASIKHNPQVWHEVWDEVRLEARDEAWLEARGEVRREVWDEVRLEARLEAWGEAWGEAWLEARGEVRREVWDEVWLEVWREARLEAWREAPAGAILALLAWPESAHLLDSDPEHVRMLAALGHKPAILLLPAAVVFDRITEVA